MRKIILAALPLIIVSACVSANLYSSPRPVPASNFGLNASAAVEYVTSVCVRAEREKRSVDELMTRWPRPIRSIERTGLFFLDQDSSGPKYALNGTSNVLIGDLATACHIVALSGEGGVLRDKVEELLGTDPQVWDHPVERGGTRRDDTVRDLWCSRGDFNGPSIAVLATSRKSDVQDKEVAELILTIFVPTNEMPCELTPVGSDNNR